MRSLKSTDLSYVTILCKIKISVKTGGYNRTYHKKISKDIFLHSFDLIFKEDNNNNIDKKSSHESVSSTQSEVNNNNVISKSKINKYSTKSVPS